MFFKARQDWEWGIVPALVLSVFVIAPDKSIKLMISYPMSTGRNFDEVLRLVDLLENSDDVQDVYYNADIPEEAYEAEA